jgi:hypothetical protein
MYSTPVQKVFTVEHYNLLGHKVEETNCGVKSRTAKLQLRSTLHQLFFSTTNTCALQLRGHSYPKYFAKSDLEIAKASPVDFTGYISFADCHSLEYEIQSRLHSSSWKLRFSCRLLDKRAKYFDALGR